MPIERKLAAIMFTDIAGYTALSAKDSTKVSELLKTQRDTLKPIVKKHGGSWMKEIGDALLLTFDSATSAVECSIAIQVATKDIDDLNLRIGIHEGEVIKQDDDVIGDDVNVASRIEPFSAVGGVAISQKIQQAISSNQEFETKYIGKPKLKGVAQEVKVYCITSHGLPETNISKVSAKLEEESKFNIFALTGGILTAIGVAFWIAVGVFDVSFGGKVEVSSIAILPLDNKGAEEDEFYAFGISSDLISDITSAGLIRVAGLKDIERIDYKNLSYEELATKLFVRFIGQGTIWKKDSIFQLSMELYDSETKKVAWSERWQKDWKNLPNIKDELAYKILKELKMDTKKLFLRMTGMTKNELISKLMQKLPSGSDTLMMADSEDVQAIFSSEQEYSAFTKNLLTNLEKGNADKNDDGVITANELSSLLSTITEAYEYYLKGKYKYEKRENTEDTEIARGLFKKAIELDDNLIKAKTSLGWTYAETSDYDKAMEIYIPALKQAEEIGDKVGMGLILINIGIVHYYKGDYDKALDYFKRSLKISEEIGDKRGMGYSHSGIGNVHKNKGNYVKALDYYKKSLAIDEELGDKYGMGNSLGNIGLLYADKGDYDNALDYYGRSLTIREGIGDKFGMGNSHSGIGNVHKNKGNYVKALDYYGRSLAIREEIGNKSGMGVSLNNIGNVHYYKGDYDKALDYYERSLAIREELGEKRGIGYFLYNIGTVYLNKGDYDKALEHLEKSLAFQNAIGAITIELETTTSLYLAYKHLGKQYDVNEIHTLIKDAENIEFEFNLRLYELIEDTSYLETAYTQVQEKIANLESDVAAKFLSYPIPKAIVEEWEKVK
jgi:tetratricopeptide (TPR) repeat protein/class 3 adenylate cyclase/TolB-like protein